MYSRLFLVILFSSSLCAMDVPASATRCLSTYVLPDGKTLHIVAGNLEDQKVDALVNPANEMLQHKGGVAQVLAHAFPGLQKKSDELPCSYSSFYYNSRDHVRCRVGQAVAMSMEGVQNAGAIRWMVHAVSPQGTDARWPVVLEAAYRSALVCAHKVGARSIAFVPMGIGIFGCPLKESARVAALVLTDYWIKQATSSIKDVYFVLWPQDPRHEEISQIYGEAFKGQAAVIYRGIYDMYHAGGAPDLIGLGVLGVVGATAWYYRGPIVALCKKIFKK